MLTPCGKSDIQYLGYPKQDYPPSLGRFSLSCTGRSFSITIADMVRRRSSNYAKNHNRRVNMMKGQLLDEGQFANLRHRCNNPIIIQYTLVALRAWDQVEE